MIYLNGKPEELNGEIVPKQLYKDTILRSKDKLEIVSFVGGG